MEPAPETVETPEGKGDENVTEKEVQFDDAFEELNTFFAYAGLGDFINANPKSSYLFAQSQKVLFVISYTINVIMIYLQLVYLYQSLHTDEDRFLLLFDMMNCWLLNIYTTTKTMYFMWKRKVIMSIILELRSLWPDPGANKQVRKILQQSMIPTKNFCVFYMKVTVWLSLVFNTIPLIYIGFNVYMGRPWNDSLFLPYTMWFPYDFTATYWAYGLTYLSQCLAGIWVCAMLSSTDGLFCLIIAHLSMQLQLLQMDITNLNRAHDDQTQAQASADVDKDIKRIVKSHNNIFNLVDKVESLFTFVLFMIFGASSVLICSELFCMTIAPVALAFKYVLFIVSSVSQISLISFYGNKLVEESEAIGYAAYDSGWTDGGMSLRQAVMLLQLRSSRPVAISALGFTSASLTTFSAIIKASWSYFTLLQNVYQPDE